MKEDRLRLTQGELEALRALVRYGTVAKAAAALQRPAATLDSQLDRVRNKSGYRHNVQLAAYAALHGLLDDLSLPR